MLTSRHLIRKVAKMSTYQNLADMRTKYLDNKQAFHESDLVSDNPLKQFEDWFLKVKECKQILEPNAMCLATSTKSGFPSARYVLLKGYGEQGFSFYTNKGSRKGQELAENPQAALVFYWEPFNRSIRIEGHVVETSDEESSSYFKRRPYASQIGAAASEQSVKIASRDDLVAKAKELEIKYPEIVERPSNWGGYTVVPKKIEFWQGQSDRLHDRIVFERSDENSPWTRYRLQP